MRTIELGQILLRALLVFVPCLALGVTFASPAAGQDTLYPCEYPADILADFQKLDFPNDMAMTAKDRADKSQEMFAALFSKYPDNFFVQRRYQDYRHNAARGEGGDIESLVKEYQDLLAKHPDDPKYLYLYARMIYDTKPVEAIRYHEKALQVAPNFPWPHLQLATIYAYGGHDLAKRQAHLEAFMKMCPSSIEFFRYYHNMEDKEFLRQSSQHLRKLLDDRTDPLALEAYDSLWAAEFRAASPADYGLVRDRQAADLARLRARNLVDSPKWYEALNSGYRTLGDTEGQKWVEDELLQHFPQSSHTFQDVTQRWQQDNPRPRETSSPEAMEAYYRSLFNATTEWIRLWPQAPMPWIRRFEAATHLKDVSDADVEAAADGYMAVAEKNADVIKPASLSLEIARVYVKRGIRLESVPQLVEKGVEQNQKQMQQFAQSLTVPQELRQMQSEMMNSIRWEGWSILADDYVKTNQPDKARDTMVKMGAFLSENKPGESAKAQTRSIYAGESREYWEKMGTLAEAQNRKMDAMGYYLNALDIPRQQYRESEKEDDTAQKARRLWKDLDGTDDGWSIWTSGHMPPANLEPGFTAWNKLNKPLPDFNLPDLSGHPWRLQDLKGKVTFLNVWATWCGPCQVEMPYVQKLYEQMKDKPDVQVLTLNIDQNPGLIDPSLRNSHYTFPIIPGAALFSQIDQFMAIPRNWIVDGYGVLRREQLGFVSKDEQWLKNTTRIMDEVRAGK